MTTMSVKLPTYSNERAPLYIVACDADRLEIHCDTIRAARRLLPLGFQQDVDRTGTIVYALSVTTDSGKSVILTALRDLVIPFAQALAGWPPSAVFEHLREQRLVYVT
jgi:hypothetical protein